MNGLSTRWPAALLSIVTAFGAACSALAAAPNPKLSGFLNTLVEARMNGGEAGVRALVSIRGNAARIESGATLIRVILEPRPGLRGTDVAPDVVAAAGGRFDAASRSFVLAWVPVSRLAELAADPRFRRVREPLEPFPLEGRGPNVSEAVGLTGAGSLQARGFTGAGVKVAVVDVGFFGLTAAINQGELAPGTVRVNLPGASDDSLESGSDHGSAVAEHVADMAPGAEIHCIMVSSEVDLQNAADYCASHGVRIANHSVAWVNGSYYDDQGPVNAIINESHDVDHVFWTLAAGNFGARHWRGGWVDANVNNSLDFTGGDERMDISDGNGYANIFLNWDQYGASVTDLDLYIYDKNGVLVGSSLDRQNGPQDPAEHVRFFYSGAGVPYRIEVRRFAGPTAGLDMTIFSFNNPFEYGSRPASLMDPADAHGAFALAAIDQAVWTSPNPPTEGFSSEGPTTDGRMKPDLSAPDGTTSLTYGHEGGYGTSFSSPTTAGAAALLLSIDPTLTPATLAAKLQSTAIDVGANGPDPVYGAGKLVFPSAAPVGAWTLPAAALALLAAGSWVLRRRRSTR